MKQFISIVLVLVLSVSVFAEPCTHNYKHLTTIAEQLGFVVTSTTKGRHNANSKHYSGKAIDVSVRNQSSLMVDMLMQIMTDMGYVVLDERTRPDGQRFWSGPHIHIHSPYCTIGTGSMVTDAPVF